MKRKFPYFCLDCEFVFYLERFEIGVTACPNCGRKRILPFHVAFPAYMPVPRIKKGKKRIEKGVVTCM